MNHQVLIGELRSAQQFFNKSSACLREEDSQFAPAEGMMTVAQQVAHVAFTVDWFVEGAFRPEGFDMNFEEHIRQLQAVTSLAEARAMVAASFERAVKTIESKSAEELAAPLPEGPVMGGLPKGAICGGISDHTAHHRGALTVYARLCGHVPEMPY
ncbi:MAG: DinB family protein [Acidobacteriota bacterium]|nr:DinB family protein [Acidobacteriota bacterium]